MCVSGMLWGVMADIPPKGKSVLLLLEFSPVCEKGQSCELTQMIGGRKGVCSQLTSADSQSRPTPHLPNHLPTVSCPLHLRLLRPILSKKAKHESHKSRKESLTIFTHRSQILQTRHPLRSSVFPSVSVPQCQSLLPRSQPNLLLLSEPSFLHSQKSSQEHFTNPTKHKE